MQQPRYTILLGLVSGLVLGPSALASDNEELDRQALPESTVRVGAGLVSEDNQYFGIYNGLTEEQVFALIEFDVVSRDDDSGLWLRGTGVDVGTDARELGFEAFQQGNWGVRIDYTELTRNHPYTVNTGLTGAGSNTVDVAGTALRDQEYELRRRNGKVTFSKKLGMGFDTMLSFRQERKEGARPWGTWIFNFVTEPIDFKTDEFVANLGYTGRDLQLSGGYMYMGYKNDNQVLNNNGAIPQVSLPLDNEAHQFSLSGGYTFTDWIRGNFKYSRTTSTQNESFFTAPDFPGNTRTSLDGEYVTTVAKANVNLRPMPDLVLNTYLRYEERDDSTPRFQFISATATRDGFNVPFSRETIAGGVEASYHLGDGMRVTGGYEREHWDRSSPPLRQVSYRDETEEDIFRVEFARAMSESINGSIALIYADRDGSAYLPSAADLIDPIHWADRERHKVQARASWTPSEVLDLQVQAEYSEDEYDGRSLGPRTGEMVGIALDASYSLNDEWRTTGWLSYNNIEADQSTGNPAAPAVWNARLGHESYGAGVGVRGELSADLGDTSADFEIGADVQIYYDESTHKTSSNDVAVTEIPDIHYRQLRFAGFVRHLIDEDSGMQFDYMYQHVRTDDWSWNNWTYNDGTTITVDESESVNFFGLSYYHNWR